MGFGSYNVYKPRIYVDWAELQKATGSFRMLKADDILLNSWNREYPDYFTEKDAYNLAGLNPYKDVIGENINWSLAGEESWGEFYYNLPTPLAAGFPDYVAYIGHNFNKAGVETLIGSSDGSYNEGDHIITEDNEFENICNFSGNVPEYDGFSICRIDGTPFTSKWIKPFMSSKRTGSDNDYHVAPVCGCISYGHIYDFGNTADMKVTQSINNKGVKKMTTISGKEVSNSLSAPDLFPATRSSYLSTPANPEKYDLGSEAWSLSNQDDLINEHEGFGRSNVGWRSGKRSWEMSFTNLDADETFGVHSANLGILLNPIGSQAEESSYLDMGFIPPLHNISTNVNVFPHNATRDGFIPSVWMKTLGGRLPFLFQVKGHTDDDITDLSNPSEFAICKFDHKSLKVKQISPCAYQISLKIYEI